MHLSKRFFSVFLAIWLPLFSGYALADSIEVQNMAGSSHGEQHSSQAILAYPGSHMSMNHVPMAGYTRHMNNSHESSDSTCGGVCNIACSGFLVSMSMVLPEILSSIQPYIYSFSRFKSTTLNPLDRPPLRQV